MSEKLKQNTGGAVDRCKERLFREFKELVCETLRLSTVQRHSFDYEGKVYLN